MQILMIHPHDPVTEPWVTRIINIALEFKKMAQEPSLVFFANQHRRSSEKYIINLPLPEDMPVYFLPRKRNSLFQNIKTIRKLAREVDLIHLQKCLSQAALPALWSAWRLDKPLHYDWDDYETAIAADCVPSPLACAEIAFYESAIPSFADTFSVSSEALREKLLHAGISPELIAEAPVGADLIRFKPIPEPEGEPIVLYMGQLEGGSFAELFIKSVALVHKKEPQVKFLVVGGGPKLDDLIQLSQILGLEKAVTFTGYLTQDKIPEILSRATIATACFENNSITRAKSPLKIVEYMAAGKAVIASQVGEVHKMLSDHCGLLVPPGNLDVMAEAILKLLKNKALRLELGENARLKAENIYNWHRTAENILALYQKAFHKKLKK